MNTGPVTIGVRRPLGPVTRTALRDISDVQAGNASMIFTYVVASRHVLMVAMRPQRYAGNIARIFRRQRMFNLVEALFALTADVLGQITLVMGRKGKEAIVMMEATRPQIYVEPIVKI